MASAEARRTEGRTARIVGSGRAGSALFLALERVGWNLLPSLGRSDDVSAAAQDADLVLIATPDSVVAEVARTIAPNSDAVIAHLAGALGLDVLGDHPRRAAIHPLVALPDANTGAERLAAKAWFAVAGDPLVELLVDDLGGRMIRVADEDRITYHAAATIASPHLVALLGQVERVAAGAGVPFEAYVDLVRATVENVAALGPAASLTGAVRRGDWDTVARHIAAIAEPERRAYEAMADSAARLAGVPVPGRTAGLAEHETISGFRKALDAERAAGRRVGLVPTMGYLHDGHASLIRRAAEECDVVAVTVFVNPLQFGPNEDLSAYPRDLARDREIASTAGAGHLLVPTTGEMWPNGAPSTAVTAGPVGAVLDGASRPGHFDGVATVVAKLFSIAGDCRAYFGEKDYQQLLVVRRLVADLGFPVEVVPCPTVREADGLAMSSRNAYLTGAERAAAPTIYRALQAGAAAIRSGERDPAAVSALMTELIRCEPAFQLDYAVAVHAADLSVPARLQDEVRLLAAARLGRARLIDNIGVTI
ncbi:MAG TPA: pantoate--beta-alanine ligase [Acidimicrobiales bacterium]|nr:pantoate--beta-alanine ligase [Acidimicrobiales bacterium]